MIHIRETGVPVQLSVKRLLAVSDNLPRDEKRLMGTARRRLTTDSIAAARENYAVKREAISGKLKIKVSGDLTHSVTASRDPLTLLNFQVRQLARGLSVVIIKGKRKLYRRGFIAKAPSGGTLAFHRTGEPKRVMTMGRYAGKVREPIAPYYGPSAADMLVNPKVFAKLQDDFWTKVGKECDRLIQRNLNGRG